MALFFGRSGWCGEDENEQVRGSETASEKESDMLIQEEEEDEERHPDPEQVQRPRPQCILRKLWQMDRSGCDKP